MNTDVNLCRWWGGDVTVSDSEPRSRKEQGYPPGEKIQGSICTCTSGDYWEAVTSTGSELSKMVLPCGDEQEHRWTVQSLSG